MVVTLNTSHMTGNHSRKVFVHSLMQG